MLFSLRMEANRNRDSIELAFTNVFRTRNVEMSVLDSGEVNYDRTENCSETSIKSSIVR